jgi:hypothetical protein
MVALVDVAGGAGSKVIVSFEPVLSDLKIDTDCNAIHISYRIPCVSTALSNCALHKIATRRLLSRQQRTDFRGNSLQRKQDFAASSL